MKVDCWYLLPSERLIRKPKFQQLLKISCYDNFFQQINWLFQDLLLHPASHAVTARDM